MREALAFGSPRRAGARSELSRYDPSLRRRKYIFYLARFDAASGGRAAASTVTRSGMIEPRGRAMYSITVSHHFMIAHSLVGTVFGPAQQLHGATFVVEAELRRDALDADGIVCDIGRALDLLKTVLAEFDYRNLDELAEFRGRNTTTEFLACEVHKRLVRRIKEGALGSQAITSLRVVLRENPVAWAAYDAPLG